MSAWIRVSKAGKSWPMRTVGCSPRDVGGVIVWPGLAEAWPALLESKGRFPHCGFEVVLGAPPLEVLRAEPDTVWGEFGMRCAPGQEPAAQGALPQLGQAEFVRDPARAMRLAEEHGGLVLVDDDGVARVRIVAGLDGCQR